jgi:hypothetical protein
MYTQDLNKTALRSLCRNHGIKNYGNMTNAEMRAALAALEADADDSLEDAVGDATPAAGEAPPAELQPVATPAAPAKAKPARPRAAVSVKAWIAEQLAAGPLTVKAVMEFVASTGRSSITAHRQIRELRMRCVKGMVVPE